MVGGRYIGKASEDGYKIYRYGLYVTYWLFLLFLFIFVLVREVGTGSPVLGSMVGLGFLDRSTVG